MYSQGGIGKIALAALIIALLLVPVTLYVALKVSNGLNDLSRTSQNLSKSLNAIQQSQKATAESLTQLQDEVNTLRGKLEEANQANDALWNNITSIASTLASIQATLELLEERLNATNSTIQAQIEDIQSQVNSLYEKLEELEESASTLFPTQIVDGTGDTVILESMPVRIVALAPSVVETLYYVNATDRLVGVTNETNWPPEVYYAVQNGTIATVGGFWTPSIEKILQLNPDLVVGVADVPSHLQVKNVLKAYGIPVILLPQSTLYDIKESILILGKATGNIVDAARSAAQYESRLMSLEVAAQQLNATRKVAIIVWVNPTYVAGNGTFQDSAIEAIGAYNAFDSIEGWQAVNPEDLLNAAPDVIILTGIPQSTLYSYLNQTLGDAANTIPAVADHRVYTLSGELMDMMNRPSPRIVYALLALQYIVYPEIYGSTPQEVPANLSQLPDWLSFPTP